MWYFGNNRYTDDELNDAKAIINFYQGKLDEMEQLGAVTPVDLNRRVMRLHVVIKCLKHYYDIPD